MDKNEIIACLAYKYNGDWNNLVTAIRQYDTEDWEEYLPIIRSMKCKYITFFSDEYPQFLKKMNKPPLCLFYYGDISLLSQIEKNVAVVGSREATEYGIEMTERIVKSISPDYTIVSGLARGLDAIAHNTALEMGGKTIAILGSGIDYCYPLSNKKLYQIIKEKGLVISEHPAESIPEPYFFPFRNRLIAAISKALIVTEAYAKSGTLTTVMFALSENKPVYCVPYPPDLDSECNRFIYDGSEMIMSTKDLKQTLDDIESWKCSLF